MIVDTRLNTANRILAILWDEYKNSKNDTPTEWARFAIQNNKLYFEWQDWKSKQRSKPWATKGSSCYPSWEGSLCVGGTMITAIAQLANWIRDRNCYAIGWWRYTTSENIGMRGGDRILPLLESSDYPKEKKCYWCGSTKKLDWYWFSVKESGYGCLHPTCEKITNLQRRK